MLRLEGAGPRLAGEDGDAVLERARWVGALAEGGVGEAPRSGVCVWAVSMLEGAGGCAQAGMGRRGGRGPGCERWGGSTVGPAGSWGVPLPCLSPQGCAGPSLSGTALTVRPFRTRGHSRKNRFPAPPHCQRQGSGASFPASCPLPSLPLLFRH